MDQVSIDRIKKLHPAIRKEAEALFDKANAALNGRAKMRITQGFRTFEEQAALYAQGRTKTGYKVTNAGPGASYHNYGLAIDFVLLIDGKDISWDVTKDWDKDDIADWMEVVRVFVAAGWTWGGNFRSIKDNPHFEKTFGFSVRELHTKYARKNTDPAGYVILK